MLAPASKKGNNIFKSDFFLQPKGKNELYVIILKCVDYLTSEQIHKLTKYYSLDFNELCFYIEQAKEFIAEKKFQIEKYKELTNKTFVKREQLKLGLSKLEENSSAYINFYNDYIKICKLYAKRKEKLKKMKAIPSDKEVGKILGIPATNVRYILQKYYDILNIDKNSSSK